MAAIVERFRQADSAMTRQDGGLGLGLALIEHIVELDGGMVHAESDGPGQADRFTITLRRASAADVADATSRPPEPPPTAPRPPDSPRASATMSSVLRVIDAVKQVW